jgi:hypothetical protein
MMTDRSFTLFGYLSLFVESTRLSRQASFRVFGKCAQNSSLITKGWISMTGPASCHPSNLIFCGGKQGGNLPPSRALVRAAAEREKGRY